MRTIARMGIAVAVVAILSVSVNAQPVTKLIDHGPDAEKLTFVVLGDGYAKSDQAKFSQDVERLVVNGVFGHDFYKDNIDAFNVYRVDLISRDSGVSSPTFVRDTALKIIYSGDWNRCWLEEGDETDQLIADATVNVAKYDYILVVANEAGYGGCRRGSKLYITSGDEWDVVAHEYGHGIGDLYDEYSVTGPYSGAPINVKNCSTVLDRDKVVWRQLIDHSIDIPTDQVSQIDPNDTVGEFTGCNYSTVGIYRPVRECRMNSNKPHFCPVCLGLMQRAVARYLPIGSASLGKTTSTSQAAPAPGQMTRQISAAQKSGTFVNMVVRIGKDKSLKVLKATEVQGSVAPLQQASPTYFLAITNRDKNAPSAAQFLPGDPYLVRGFVDPQHKEKGELLAQADFATITVNLPKTDLQSATHDTGLQLYRADAGALSDVGESEFSDQQGLKQNLLAKKGVKKQFGISAKQLGEALRSMLALAQKIK